MNELVERAMAAVRYWADEEAYAACQCEQCVVLRKALAALFAEAAERNQKAERAAWKDDLDAVARAVYPHKQDRFTYSVDFMIAEIAKLRAERDAGLARERALREALKYTRDTLTAHPWPYYDDVRSQVIAVLAANPEPPATEAPHE